MSRQGVACFIPKPPKCSQSKDGFSPYIFTHKQIADIFEKSLELRLINQNKQTALICVPSVLRLLYSTGLRISEALSIRNEDIKFDKGYILIRKTKNGAERIVPMHDSLKTNLLQYKSFRDTVPVDGINEPDYWFFISTNGAACSDKAITWWYQQLLEQCGIPYMGGHRGPRVHDLRHTFAVHSLMQMVRVGIDLYTSLPIISTCLGHKSVAATEKYVRLTSEMYPELVTQCSESYLFVYPKIEKTL
jgi:integrase